MINAFEEYYFHKARVESTSQVTECKACCAKASKRCGYNVKLPNVEYTAISRNRWLILTLLLTPTLYYLWDNPG